MQEAEFLATKVAYLNNGMIQVQGSPDKVLKSIHGGYIKIRVVSSNLYLLHEEIKNSYRSKSFPPDVLEIEVPEEDIDTVLQKISRVGGIREISTIKPSFESLFLNGADD
jgi:ABC-type multidrug transport system ATPase subunit